MAGKAFKAYRTDRPELGRLQLGRQVDAGLTTTQSLYGTSRRVGESEATVATN